MHGRHLLSSWSRTQQCVALSSGEAELNATLKAACEGLNIKYLMEEMNIEIGLEIFGDSSAAQGTLQRLGIGKVKHLATRQLWLQEHVFKGEVIVKKIGRSSNWADVLTHPWGTKDEHQFESMSITSSGRLVDGKVCQ